MGFEEFFSVALGVPDAVPHPHQLHLAEHGLPEVLTAPTGTGKTEAAILGHLWRRMAHPDESVRKTTPRWLVIALPTRGLVHQSVDRARSLVGNLGLDVEVHAVLGGESWTDSGWRSAPRLEAIFVGTVDMLLSRALNRGYVDSRWNWPISFGLFNHDVQWVFDEVQQMELATITSRQLQAFRQSFGTVKPTASMWMSATLDDDLLQTVDNPTIDRRVDAVELAGASDEFRRRTDAPKRILALEVADRKTHARDVAAAVARLHRPGTRTLVVCNTVQRAQSVFRALTLDAEVCLLHRRFRPPERKARTAEAFAPVDAKGPGRVVVATQVLEAGIDIDAAAVVTELAPWSSIVQRAGRCNRQGRIDEATVHWVDLADADSSPYDPDELAEARDALRSLEGQVVTPTSLPSEGPPSKRRVHHVLRRRDLLELFDTSPDLSGDPLDVSQFIRDGDERDVFIAWRDTVSADMGVPEPDELCPVSIVEARRWAGQIHQRDPRSRRASWVPARPTDLRPGEVYVAPSTSSGYDTEIGWSRTSKTPVPPIAVTSEISSSSRDDIGVGDEPASTIGAWYPLDRHLDDVDRAAADLIDTLAPRLPDSLRTACVDAAALHDLGKAHDVWQSAAKLLAEGSSSPPPNHPVAKTPTVGRLRFKQPHFRHELASLVALRGSASGLIAASAEPDLCCYLIASHHGRVRLSVRSVPGESSPDGTPVALGVVHGSLLPKVATPRGLAPGGRLDVAETMTSWTRTALALRDRPDLGPFRLAFLEAVVRLADWEASRLITSEVDP